MKTDLYTKVILTVIAFVLTVNLLRDVEIIPSATAAQLPAPQTEEIKQAKKQVTDVNIVQINGQSVGSVLKVDFDNIPYVRIANTADVNINNTPYVNINNTPNVRVTNTVDVRH